MDRITLPPEGAEDTPENVENPIDLQSILADQCRQTKPIHGIVVGCITSIQKSQVFVDYPGNPACRPINARTTTNLQEQDHGKDVALLFEGEDPYRPIIIGKMHSPQSNIKQTMEANIEVDNKKLVLTAEREIVLQCGKAFIILTRSGKVILRGTYLLSRSSGINRIRGGSIQLN